jgi:adenosine deaminase
MVFGNIKPVHYICIKLRTMEKLKIHFGVQGNGIVFGFMPSEYDSLKKRFPDAQPAKRIFVEYDLKSNFEKYHAHLENYIFPALVGLSDLADLRKIKSIDFIKTPEYEVTYTIEQKNDQEVQSLSR